MNPQDKSGLPKGGTSLRKLREDRGLSQDDVARRLGISQAAVSAMETAPQRIAFARAVELACIYGVSLQWFQSGTNIPDVDLAGIAIELQHFGLTDVTTPNPRPPGAFRHLEEVVALIVRDAPSPRIVNGIPALLIRNAWSAELLVAFAEHHRTLRRVAWLLDITRTIAGQGIRLPSAAAALASRCADALARVGDLDISTPDSLGTPTDDPKTLSRLHRRWGITYDQSLESFRERTEFLLNGSP